MNLELGIRFGSGMSGGTGGRGAFCERRENEDGSEMSALVANADKKSEEVIRVSGLGRSSAVAMDDELPLGTPSCPGEEETG